MRTTVRTDGTFGAGLVPAPIHAVLRFVAVLALTANGAVAHPGESARARLNVTEDGIVAEVVFTVHDVQTIVAIDANGDDELDVPELEAARDALEQLSPAVLELAIDGRPLTPASIEVSTRGEAALGWTLRYRWPAGGDRAGLDVSSPLLRDMPGEPRMLLVVTDADEGYRRAFVDRGGIHVPVLAHRTR